MNFDLARKFAAAVRKHFAEATADSAEDEHGNVWKHPEVVFDTDRDIRVRAAPDFHEWREK